MPKCIWEELGLPLHSNHVLRMTSVNTSVNSTVGVFENLALDFSAGEVLLQVQIMGCANFDLLLGRPFHCLMSATNEDSPNGAQSIMLHNPNMGKQYALPTVTVLFPHRSCLLFIHTRCLLTWRGRRHYTNTSFLFIRTLSSFCFFDLSMDLANS